MSITIADRVRQSSTTTGTGSMSLSSTILSSYVGFGAAGLNGLNIYYCIVNRNANEWEVGIGKFVSGSPDTIVRQQVFAGSNGTSFVNFSAGTKDIWLTEPAQFGQQIQANLYALGNYQ